MVKFNLQYFANKIIVNSNGKILLNTDGKIITSAVQQLEAPTISISGSTLTIPDVTNATSYDLYVDGVYNSNIPKASGYTVNIQFTGYGGVGDTHVIINGTDVGYLQGLGSNTYNNVSTIRMYTGYSGWHITNSTGNFVNGTIRDEMELTITQNSSCSMEEFD